MRPESKLQFEQAAKALGLDPATRDLAWRRMSDIGLSPDDPTVVFLAVGGLLEQAAATLPAAINALPARIEDAARRAVGPVTKAATSRVEAAHAALAEQTGSAVAKAALDHFERTERVQSTALGLRLFGVMAAVGIVCGVIGYAAGRANVTGVATEWAALATRTDAGAWFGLANANSDLNLTLRQHCKPGAPGVLTVNNGRACSVPLWLEGSTAPTTGTFVVLYSTALDALAAWGPAWLLSIGLLAGLFGRKTLLSISNIKPIAWIIK